MTSDHFLDHVAFSFGRVPSNKYVFDHGGWWRDMILLITESHNHIYYNVLGVFAEGRNTAKIMTDLVEICFQLYSIGQEL